LALKASGFSFQDFKLRERKCDFFAGSRVFSRHAQGSICFYLESELDVWCAAWRGHGFACCILSGLCRMIIEVEKTL
jgi:hypothetical protein